MLVNGQSVAPGQPLKNLHSLLLSDMLPVSARSRLDTGIWVEEY